MAIIAWTDVTAHAPELASIPLAGQPDYLALANTWVDVNAFDGEDGPKTKMARIWVAAHFATLDKLRGTAIAGPVIAETRGSLSRQYANLIQMSLASGLFGQTTYGQNYATLVRTSPRARMPVVA